MNNNVRREHESRTMEKKKKYAKKAGEEKSEDCRLWRMIEHYLVHHFSQS